MDNGEEAYQFTRDIFSSIRKLFIASIMYNKMLICVTGLQGAGKTTLMKNFYELDEKYLNISRGRGERIPVMITEEKDLKTPVMLAYKVMKIVKDGNEKYDLQQMSLSCDEFVNATKGEDEIMYLELKVPYKHTFNSGVSFLLLPGFEKENEYWNSLIEFSINSSDAAVMVFNDQSFATADNADLVNKIESIFGSDLVYAITGSDTSSDDNNEVKQTCIKALKIPTSETDRVICTGSYNDSSVNKAWIESFKAALTKYAYGDKDVNRIRNNSKYIYDETIKIKDALFNILNIINSDTAVANFREDGMIKEFNKSARKMRDVLESNLDDEIEMAKKESGERLESLFMEQRKGVKGKLLAVKKFFLGANVKEQFTQTRETVEKSLMTVDGKSIPNQHIGLAMKKCLITLDSPKEERTNLGRLIDSKTDNNQVVLLNNEHNTMIFEDISHVLSDYSTTKEHYSIKCENPKRLMGAVAEVGTYYYGLQVYNSIAEIANLPYYSPAKPSINADKVLQGANASKTFVAGLAGIMGVDLLGDGTLNMVSQIAASLGIAAPVAGAIAIGIVAVGGVTVVIKDMNKMQREDFLSARLTVNSIYDGYKNKRFVH